LERPSLQTNFLTFARDPFVWKTLHAIGVLLVMALYNISKQGAASSILKLFFVSVALSVLILWTIATVILVPILAQQHAINKQLNLLEIGFILMRLRKRLLAISLSVLFFSWPLIFFYVFIALTLSQSIIFSQLSECEDKQFVLVKTAGDNA